MSSNKLTSLLGSSNLRNRSFKRLKARSGVREDLRFHDLRPSCDTLLFLGRRRGETSGSPGAGLAVPTERFERLEEALQLAHQMWSGEAKPYKGQHYRLEEAMNNPPALSRPRPPVMVGGMGEKMTLRLVAQYADACNLFAYGGRGRFGTSWMS